MASIYVASIATCGTHPFCFSPSATFKPHGGKQPPPHHNPPTPPSFLYLTLPNRRRQTPLSPLSRSSLTFCKPFPRLLKTISSPTLPPSWHAFSRRKARSPRTYHSHRLKSALFPKTLLTEHGILCNKISSPPYFGRISCSAIALALHTKRPAYL